MLIPLRHGQMSARRWPVVTFALIAINVVAFVATTGVIDRDSTKAEDLIVRLVILAAAHPEVQRSPLAEKFLTGFQHDNPEVWAEVSTHPATATQSLSQTDSELSPGDDPAELQREMQSIDKGLKDLTATSFTWKYAFIAGDRNLIGYLTSNFLHGGWLHLIGNMWFLWLAGFILEDVWGRPLYIAFYLIAGIAATQLQAWSNPGSMIPQLGASGAVAGLMGAFLVRFPRMKIHMAWLFMWRLIRFDASAYWLLPLWLLVEIFSGSIWGSSEGVAHWAHVGGFVFGAAVAVAIRHSGLEQKANVAIEKRVNLLNDPEIRQAMGMIDREEFAGAAGLLEAYVNSNPESIDGWSLLCQTYRRKGDKAGYFAALTRVCEIHLQQREPDAAWDAYEEFVQAGGDTMPAGTWLKLGRIAEDRKEYERALAEYEKLTAKYRSAREGLDAQLRAALISMKHLGHPGDALKWYEAASVSAVPHLDLEREIQMGIAEARAAMGKSAGAAGA
jgi:membrane associated rhomboid family serine protease